MKEMKEIVRLFPVRIRDILNGENLDFFRLQEIRLRVGCPLQLICDGRERILKELEPVASGEIRETLEAVGRHSLYAYEEELRQGFLTIAGGHRVGVAGKVVLEENRVRSMTCISFLNIRLSHQVKGCADKVMPWLYDEKGQVCHSLIISPPGCGKTTLLRDMIRQISDGTLWGGSGHMVGVVDERSELAGCYQGIPSNDLGIRTDVMDCCPKAEGMMMLIRSMSPQVIAVDEIGSLEEIPAIHMILRCGCKLLATVHGQSLDDVMKKELLQKLVREQVFERYVVLGRDRSICVLDGKGGLLYQC